MATASATPNLAARGIVAFAKIEWRGVWYSRHQIIRRLAQTCPVVVVDHPAHARDMFRREAREAHGSLVPVAPNLWAYRSPCYLPQVYRPSPARRALEALQAFHLRATLRRLGLRQPVCYVWHPEYGPAVGRLPRWPTIYHCYDKFDAYHAAPAATIRALEEQLVERSSLVMASSRVLASDLEERTGHPVRYLPHGVDFEHFRHRSMEDPAPKDLDALPRPRIGYIARLDERIDSEALEKIARQRPEWSLVIIGASGFQSQEGHARFQSLAQLPNVHALGERPREEIPAYIAALDVCLMCYRTDNWGRWVQPLKAYEYLACGKPVVSAPIDSASDFGDLVRVVREGGSWIGAIEESLSADGPEEVARRIGFARRNTWDMRAGEVALLIEEQLTAMSDKQPS